ncbi:hypothetical protein ACWNYH_00485 [Candidatus Vidania fulgoroideorum]
MKYKNKIKRTIYFNVLCGVLLDSDCVKKYKLPGISFKNFFVKFTSQKELFVYNKNDKRSFKLLLKKKEIEKIYLLLKKKGFKLLIKSIVNSKGLVKLELLVVKQELNKLKSDI